MNHSSNSEIVKLISAGVERPDLDYKEDINLEKKDAKAEITKDIIAMANTNGGVIIGGVRETPTGFVKIGMSPEVLAAFDSTKLNQFVNNYCDPPINSTTQVIEDEGKYYGVIFVPEFGEQPHIVTRDYLGVFIPGDFLVRTANNESRRAGPHELRELLNKAITRRQGGLQKFLQSALQSTRPQILDQPPQPDPPIPFDTQKYLEKYPGFRIVRIKPVNSPPYIELHRLKRLVEQSSLTKPSSGSISFPSANPRDITEIRLPIGIACQYENEEFRYLGFSYFDVDGNIFIAESLWEDRHGGREVIGSLGVTSCYLMIIESILFARQYYQNSIWEGHFNVRFSVESMIPRQLAPDMHGFTPFYRAYQSDISNTVSVERDIKTGVMWSDIEMVATEMFREFCWFFHYDLEHHEDQRYLQVLKEKNLLIPRNLLESDRANSGMP